MVPRDTFPNSLPNRERIMSEKAQSFQSHAKLVPAYHYWGLPALALPTLYFAYLAITNFSVERLVFLAFATAVVVVGLFARVFALGVQDRVIRLEERMRLERTLPDDLRGRIMDLSTDQLIGLRFAPDGELADLTKKALDGGMGRKEIKQAIKEWRADNQRI